MSSVPCSKLDDATLLRLMDEWWIRKHGIASVARCWLHMLWPFSVVPIRSLSELCARRHHVQKLESQRRARQRWVYFRGSALQFLPQHFLYFLPEPQLHGSFGFTLGVFTRGVVGVMAARFGAVRAERAEA
mmetsp:Transcript_3144/g.9949  ORF Transcript_3144/g.9949 Transcript_3144/m.9949 type:complete len:131 (+) Transcript_3144:223-615(+)